MNYYLTELIDILMILSNFMFLLPMYGAYKQNRFTRMWVFFWMIWASFFYHLCDSFAVCIFSFITHHHLDFFFAQNLILLTILYFINFSQNYPWVERGLIILGMIIVVILQITLPSDLIVQAGLVVAALIVVVVYWIIYAMSVGKGKIPKYEWDMILIGLGLTFCSIMLYSYQSTFLDAYAYIHSLWHILAACGQYYLLYIKPAAAKYRSVDSRINKRY